MLQYCTRLTDANVNKYNRIAILFHLFLLLTHFIVKHSVYEMLYNKLALTTLAEVQ